MEPELHHCKIRLQHLCKRPTRGNGGTELRKAAEKHVSAKAELIQPVFIKLSPKEIDGLEENTEKCKDFGYKYEVVDGSLKIYSIPSQTNVASGPH